MRAEKKRGAAARRDRRLRRLVLTLPACVQRLPGLQRQVLVLRAGVGAGAPRSRARVARRLDLSVSRVARLERTGVRHLQTLGRANSCAGTPASSSAIAGAGVTAGTSATAGVARHGSGGGSPGGGAKPSDGGSGSRGASDDNGGGRQGIGGVFATSPPVGGGAPSSVAAWVPILLAALAALSAGYLAVGSVRQLRARRQ